VAAEERAAGAGVPGALAVVVEMAG